MKILMIGNICSIGWNFKKGLEEKGYHVDLIGKQERHTTGIYKKKPQWLTIPKHNKKYDYDIIHVHYPHILKIPYIIRHTTKNSKKTQVIFHWHGTDIRRLERYPIVKKIMLNYTKNHLYSTQDLNYFLKGKGTQVKNPIDTNQFKIIIPIEKRPYLILNSTNDHTYPILHKDMPLYYNQYKYIKHQPPYNLSPYYLYMTILEAILCGCKSFYHPHLDREKVIYYHNITNATKELIKYYNQILQ